MKKQRRYSAEEKFLILREAQEHGVVETCRKHGVDPTTYYSWKERYEAEGIAGLLPRKSGRTPDAVDHKKLEKENQVLKKLVADKELIIEMQLSLLKKKSMGDRRGKKR